LGIAVLEAHPFLESLMCPHQARDFKMRFGNLVEEDSGGCVLANM